MSFCLLLSYNASVDQKPLGPIKAGTRRPALAESLPDLVTWQGSHIPYRYCRSRRRTLCITIYPDLIVLVRAPLRAAPGDIREFVLSHARWIMKTRQKLESRAAVKPPGPRYTSGEAHPYLGQAYPLEVQQGVKPSVGLLSGRICVTTKGEPTEEMVKKLLHRWYSAQADIIFHEHLAACLRTMPKDFPLPPLRIRPMRSRWGSFSPKGRIALNLWLITMPLDCLDYVIFHELCHYKVRGHGKRFWELLERFLPEWRMRRKELNAHGLPWME